LYDAKVIDGFKIILIFIFGDSLFIR
jgi:hypothetical protein